jgi:hypothetical protein
MSLMVAEDATDMGRARMSVVWWSRRLDVRLRALANGRRWPATDVRERTTAAYDNGEHDGSHEATLSPEPCRQWWADRAAFCGNEDKVRRATFCCGGGG